MIRRALGAAALAAIPFIAVEAFAWRVSGSVLRAPRYRPEEAGMRGAVDALGGANVRLTAADGVGLGARWLPSEPAPGDPPADPHEAILLLHGYNGSIAPFLVEHAAYLRRIAGVLGLDFRGHGASDPSPTTFGLREVEDVAAALAWLGERGIRRVVIFGSSMGAMTALASVAVLGDGRLAMEDVIFGLPGDATSEAEVPVPRPLIAGVVCDSIVVDLGATFTRRMQIPFGREYVAERIFEAIGRQIGGDPRETEPSRIIDLVAPVPVLFVHSEADLRAPASAVRQLARRAAPGSEVWIVPDGDHIRIHRARPEEYETRVEAFVRAGLEAVRPATENSRTGVAAEAFGPS